MNPDTSGIIDQIAGAITTAQTTGKMLYVFNDSEGWFYSGKMPENQSNFYIVYSNGSYDRLGNVPELGMSDWNDYYAQFEPQPVIPAPVKEKRNILSPFKKHFIWYCAFAPYFALAACVIMHGSAAMANPIFWSFSFAVSMMCIPLSLMFSLAPLVRPKNQQAATVATILASDSHLLFYGGLWLLSAHGVALLPMALIAIGLMVSMAGSGLALLLMFDNEKKPVELPSEPE